MEDVMNLVRRKVATARKPKSASERRRPPPPPPPSKGPPKKRGTAPLSLPSKIGKRKEAEGVPLKYFENVVGAEIEDLNDAIDELIAAYPPNYWPVVRVLRIIKRDVPARLAKEFFDFIGIHGFEDRLPRLFNEFVRDPETIRAMKVCRELKLSRVPIPTSSHPPIYMRKSKGAQFKANLPRTLPSQQQRYGMAGLDPICVSDYRYARWMPDDLGVMGMVLRDEGSYTIPTKVGEWFKVKKSWYEMACGKTGRQFEEGAVGYLLNDGKTVIVETKEMFDRSKAKRSSVVTTIRDAPSDERTVRIVKSVLLDNEFVTETMADEIIRTIPIGLATNGEVAKGIARVLVFLTPLIDRSQIHLVRAKAGQLSGLNLIKFEPEQALPEVYRNPRSDKAKMDEIIAQRSKEIENDIIDRLDRVNRVAVTGARIEGKKMAPFARFKPLRVDTALIVDCPPNTTDVIYDTDESGMYCFSRIAMKGATTNPITRKPLSDSFLDEMAMIENPQSPEELVEIEREIVIAPQQRSVAKEWAPGLFEKLREEIRMLTPIYCSECNIETVIPFKSVHAGKVVQFCNLKCFNAYKFTGDNK